MKIIKNKIRLVIWDLDETFWSGTLSEGIITPIDFNLNLVKELTDRGIVNSISSKNNFMDAKIELEKLSAWKYFVFPVPINTSRDVHRFLLNMVSTVGGLSPKVIELINPAILNGWGFVAGGCW